MAKRSKRRMLGDLMKVIKQLLTKHKELTIRQIALRTKTQWMIARRCLEIMKDLDLVKERKGVTKAEGRRFSLIKI